MSKSPGNLLMVLKSITTMLVEQSDGSFSDGPALVDPVFCERRRSVLLCKRTSLGAPHSLHNVSCANQPGLFLFAPSDLTVVSTPAFPVLKGIRSERPVAPF
jgi:hypothetical protein